MKYLCILLTLTISFHYGRSLQQTTVQAPDLTQNSDIALHNIGIFNQEPLFCFVVRTYWAHGDDHGGGLRRLLQSLQRQKSHSRWEAVILVADSQPFPDLSKIVLELQDSRIWVFAEWIGPEFAARIDGAWAPNYHGLLYNLTDDAIHVCPPDTSWLVVTNGDNEYADTFIERVNKEVHLHPGGVDIVAFDYYSRYQRVTMPACDRFRATTDSPPTTRLKCKQNALKWCRTDLGASALNYRKFKDEGRYFGSVEDALNRNLGPDSSDGVMMENLVRDGWLAVHVTDSCLFNHAPSIQSCAWQGGVWDDRDIIASGGGSCLTPDQADAILSQDPTVEHVIINNVSNDGRVDGFQGAKQRDVENVKCLRYKQYKSADILGLTQVWFSQWCTDDEDKDEFSNYFDSFFPTEEDVEAAIKAVTLHGRGNRTT